VHPEQFELKALVAGRLDAHRRREIDDHLGSCADCSRHYVALMLGSASPKTAEAESRQGHAPSSAGVLTFAGSGAATEAPMYGIDAPLAAPVPRPTVTRPPHSNLAALETEFVPPPSRTPVPVSNSFVDAITKLRAESEQAQLTAMMAAAKALERPPAPPVIDPTPAVDAPVTREDAAPAAVQSSIAAPQHPPAPTAQVLPSLLQDEPAASTAAAPELIVTFSSTPTRFARRRIVTPVVPADAVLDAPYVSRAIPLPVAAPVAAHVDTDVVVAAVPAYAAAVAPAFDEAAESAYAAAVAPAFAEAAEPAFAEAAEPAYSEAVAPAFAHGETASPFDSEADAVQHDTQRAQKPRSAMSAALVGGAALVLIAAVGGFRYFQSSVSQAASTAAAAAVRQVEATAARTAAGVAAAAAAAPAPVPASVPVPVPVPVPAPAVETRIVYVRAPAKQEPAMPVETAAELPPVPIAVTLPDVNLQTSTAETGTNANAQRDARSELTRSARATAPRTTNPRP